MKKKVAKVPAAPKAPAKKVVKSKPVAPATPKTVASTKRNPPAKEVVTASTSAASGGSADIVTGYGFDSVKSSSCTGAVYSFNAARSGKAYLIKVNAASGELTEVKKL